ncbi:ABC superfamily transporter [Peptoniphilus sp. ING2-D1G]|nr:ABC superfamily transporter [Peptoniphilus sp. ING2-D1G]
MLKLKNIYKDYYDFEFELKDISFELEEGYIMGLIGPNGAGKTTIINLIMNLIKPSKGEIEIFGRENTLENNEYIKDNIGFVFDKSIYPEYLNLDKLEFIYKNIYSNFDKEYFDELVERFKISKLKNLKDQSKGNLMRTQIVLALSHNAKFIVMDEPSQGLDPVVRRELLKVLREYREKTNAAVLFSTHITEDLEQIADYITFINKGELIFTTDIETLRDKYKILKTTSQNKTNYNLQDFIGFEENEFYFSGLIEKQNIKSIVEGDVIRDATIQDIMYYYYGK